MNRRHRFFAGLSARAAGRRGAASNHVLRAEDGRRVGNITSRLSDAGGKIILATFRPSRRTSSPAWAWQGCGA
jgi:hypothetical protein